MEYVYAALLLHKAGKPVNEENLKKVIEATGNKADESKLKTLTASLKDVDIDKELESATLAAPQGGGESGEEKKGKEEEEKEEKKEEAAEGLGSLFG